MSNYPDGMREAYDTTVDLKCKRGDCGATWEAAATWELGGYWLHDEAQQCPECNGDEWE